MYEATGRLLEVDETRESLGCDDLGLARYVESGDLHPVMRQGQSALFAQREVMRLMQRLAVEAGVEPDLDPSAAARIGAQVDQLRATVTSFIGAVANGADPDAALHTLSMLFDGLDVAIREASSPA